MCCVDKRCCACEKHFKVEGRLTGWSKKDRGWGTEENQLEVEGGMTVGGARETGDEALKRSILKWKVECQWVEQEVTKNMG